jgi:hypothetical protein
MLNIDKGDIQEQLKREGPRLLDQVRDTIRRKHYSIRTEHAYLGWIKRFILFHQKRHPMALGKPEIEGSLFDSFGSAGQCCIFCSESGAECATVPIQGSAAKGSGLA